MERAKGQTGDTNTSNTNSTNNNSVSDWGWSVFFFIEERKRKKKNKAPLCGGYASCSPPYVERR